MDSSAAMNRGTNNDGAEPYWAQQTQLPESLSGDNHPLMLQASNAAAAKANSSEGQFDPKTVKEVLTDANGKSSSVPLDGSKLSPGDHTLQFENGRQFVVHVPQNDGKQEMPVMFVIAPSVHTNQGYDAKNFEVETGMNQYADRDKFVAVYALNKNHLLGDWSKLPAEAWNAPGSGINDADLQKNGWNDEDYIKAIASMMPSLANVDASHKDWGAIAFSQGGMFLNQLSHDVPNLFPSVGLVGSTFQDGHDYTTADGNAKNVMLVNMHGDTDTYPYPHESGLTFKAEYALVHILDGVSNLLHDAGKLLHGHWPTKHQGLANGWGSHLAERLDPLGAINNFDENARTQQNYYEQRMKNNGGFSLTSVDLPSPAASSKKDHETRYNSKNGDALTIYDLATAKHSWPGPDHGSHVNSTAQYTEFDSSKAFVDLFDKYNESIKI